MDTSGFEEIANLEQKLLNARLPEPLMEKGKEMLLRLSRVAKMGGNFAVEYDNTARYIDWITTLPWDKKSTDILDLHHAQEILDKNHHGLKPVKDKILEYLSVLALTKQTARAPILLLVGLAGTGKTTLAYSIAEGMGRKFDRIPFGGIGDALYLRGQSRAYPDAEPGAIIKALQRCQTKNPVILLDEIDRVDEEARNTIMGVLVELLDPGQNNRYTDHFLDYPFDLSEVLFVATANNTTHISTAVLDRLEPIMMPSYSDDDKVAIGRDFILPKAIKDANLPPNSLEIDPNVWNKVVRPLGFDGGIRTLERTIANIVRKTAREIVSGTSQKVVVTEANLNDYLPK